MNIEGRLDIRMQHRDGSVQQVDIASTRPLQAARVFTGMTPDEVLRNLPLLYSVCATAQSLASQRAFDRALSNRPAEPVQLARDLLVQLETLREHLWRVLIDWPDFLDEQVDAATAAPLVSMIQQCRAALFAGEAFGSGARLQMDEAALQGLLNRIDILLQRQVFGMRVQDWLALRGADGLNGWAGSVDTIAGRLLARIQQQGWETIGDISLSFLPQTGEDELERCLTAADADAFIAAPRWRDAPCETTPLSRQHEHPLIRSIREDAGAGLLARVTAMLVELASIPAQMRGTFETLQRSKTDTIDDSEAGSNTTGIGQVEAARGRLVHRVELKDGAVERYQILAPTEWNFHPEGAAARGLRALQADDEDELRRQAELLISAVDPCVGYDLRIR